MSVSPCRPAKEALPFSLPPLNLPCLGMQLQGGRRSFSLRLRRRPYPLQVLLWLSPPRLPRLQQLLWLPRPSPPERRIPRRMQPSRPALRMVLIWAFPPEAMKGVGEHVGRPSGDLLVTAPVLQSSRQPPGSFPMFRQNPSREQADRHRSVRSRLSFQVNLILPRQPLQLRPSRRLRRNRRRPSPLAKSPSPTRPVRGFSTPSTVRPPSPSSTWPYRFWCSWSVRG